MLIVVDGACDLSPRASRRSDIVVLPFRLFADRLPLLETGGVGELMASGARLVSKPPGEKAFALAYEGQREVIVLATSARLSTALEHAELAAQRATARVQVIDTRTFSVGSGLAVEVLLALLDDETEIEQLARWSEGAAESIRTYAIVGRPSVIVGRGLLGRTKLSTWRRPVVSIRGRARLVRQAPTRARAIAWLGDHVVQLFGRPPRTWAVAHAQAHDVETVVARLRDVFGSEPAFVTIMNPTAAIHLGPDAVVVALMAP